jgi:lathosterol oxidase
LILQINQHFSRSVPAGGNALFPQKHLIMLTFLEEFGYLITWLLSALVIYGRYLLLAGVAYFLFYRFGFGPARRKIQASLPAAARVRGELKESATTALVFGAVGLLIVVLRAQGLTLVYTDLNAYGWWYLPVSFVLLVVLHDTYFYWMHRLMHRSKWLRTIHAAHHGSYNPNPLTAMAFHPLEALAEIAIIPVLLFVLPAHPLVLLLFGVWSLGWNIIGHLGYELFPAGFVRHPVGRYFNTSTHHNQHHLDGRYNFGLYFNYWDRWFGTNNPTYEQTFASITEQLGDGARVQGEDKRQGAVG